MILEGFIFVGFEYMFMTGRCEGTDQILGTIYVQDRRTGKGTDLMQDAMQSMCNSLCTLEMVVGVLPSIFLIRNHAPDQFL